MKVRHLTLRDYMGGGYERLKNWFDEIAAHSAGEFNAEQVQDAISSGLHIGWGWFDDDDSLEGIIVTTIANYHNYKALSVVGAAGATRDAWGELDNVFNAMAAQQDCSEYEIKGRKGFIRKLKEFGWKEKYTVISCKTKFPEVAQLRPEEEGGDHGQTGVSGRAEVSAGD